MNFLLLLLYLVTFMTPFLGQSLVGEKASLRTRIPLLSGAGIQRGRYGISCQRRRLACLLYCLLQPSRVSSNISNHTTIFQPSYYLLLNAIIHERILCEGNGRIRMKAKIDRGHCWNFRIAS